MKLRSFFAVFCLCAVFVSCPDAGSNQAADPLSPGGDSPGAVLFPTSVGSRWVYEKSIYSSSSGSGSSTVSLFLFLELLDYDAATGTYRLSLDIPIENTHYYGNPNPPPYDLVTTYTVSSIVLLRSSGSVLSMSADDGVSWQVLCNSANGSSFSFSSFLTSSANIWVSSSQYSGYIGSYPFHPFGQFSGVRTEGNSGASLVYEWYSPDVGILESMVSGQVFSPGITGLLEASTTYNVQSVKLLGCHVGDTSIGEDPDVIRYGKTYTY
jgi:hypothetical protein